MRRSGSKGKIGNTASAVAKIECKIKQNVLIFGEKSVWIRTLACSSPSVQPSIKDWNQD